MDDISNLWTGRAGLLKTYWGYGILASIPWTLALFMVKPGSEIAILVVLAWIAYYLAVHVGIWRAASLYAGPKAWAVLAKIAVAMTPVFFVIGVLVAVILPAMQPSAGKGKQAAAEIQMVAVKTGPWGENDKRIDWERGVTNPSEFDRSSWIERVEDIRSDVTKGIIPSIAGVLLSSAPPDAISSLDVVSAVENSQTWWREHSGETRIHIVNTAARLISGFQFEYSQHPCGVAGQISVFNVALTGAIQKSSQAVVDLPSHPLLNSASKQNCLSIKAIW